MVGRPIAGKEKGRTKRVAFLITPELREELEARATRERSMGDIVNEALEQYFAKRRRTEKDRAA